MTTIDRRQMLSSGALLAASALARPASLLAAPAADPLPLSLVHPDLRAMVPQIEAMSRGPAMTRASLAQMRGPSPLAGRPLLEDVPHERRMIPVPGGNPDVPIYIVNARPDSSRPAILHTHGGGFIAGRASDSVRDLQETCKALDCAAVSVDYRLAPETGYKGSIEDNYAGLVWLHANAAELGADPARIAVMGESAGGGHAALLAITARDRGKVPLVFQCLTYPMLDDRTGTTRPVPRHVGTLIWTAERNRFGWESFLGTTPGLAHEPKGAVPARVANLAGLPPAFIGVGSLDLFRDEDIAYAQRLYAAGVMSELVVVPGCFHGFDMLAMLMKAPLGTWFRDIRLDALRRAFGLPGVA